MIFKEWICGAGGMAQAVECMYSKHEGLSSNTSTAKNKTKEWTCGQLQKQVGAGVYNSNVLSHSAEG
jgi:hypothetical protein